MKKRLKWQKKLTMEELEHVKEYGGRTLTGFKYNRKVQAKMRELNKCDYFPEPCFTCRLIALKLGIET
jgi:hypothetical protein